jgi:hypothetical protein
MTTRDERLLQLKSAVEDWADRMEERLQDEADFLRSVRDGLTASGSVSNATTQAASQLTQDELDEFLEA